MKRVRAVLAAVCVSATVAGFVVFPSVSAQSASGVVISEFRVRGPNGAADEFVELFNAGSTDVNIGGWKINGSNNAAGVSTRLTITANTILRAGCHFLATNSSASGGPYSGTVPGNQTYATGITDDGGIALFNGTTIEDQVGLSAGSAYKEGTPLAPLSTSAAGNLDKSYERKPGGTAGNGIDADNNHDDFSIVAPSNPQNLLSPCVTTQTTNPSGAGAASPTSVDPGDTALLTVTVTPGRNPTSSGLAVSADLSAIGGAVSQQFFDDGSHGDAAAADNIFSFSAAVTATTVPGSKGMTATITDAELRTSTTSIVLVVRQPPIAIDAIQGAGLLSPHDGEVVSTSGIVTALRSNGFFLQTPDADVDTDEATSEGIFVFTSSAPTTAVGQLVEVVGRVQEFRPGGAGTPPITELSGTPVVAVVSSGHSLPSPAALLPAFTTADGGLEQLERFEGMRVTGNFEVVSPTAAFGLSATQEKNADSGTSRGEFYMVIRGVARPFREPGLEPAQALPAGTTACCVPRFDGNPERLRVLSGTQTGTAKLDVVSRQVLNGFTGVMDYGFNTWTILPDPGAAVPGDASATPVPSAVEGEFTIGSFNMERFFDTTNDAVVDDVALTPEAFERRLNKVSLAIRNVLRMPDVLGAVEIENLGVLQAIASRVNNDALASTGVNPGYLAYLEEGNDIGGIDVGFLVKSTRVDVVTVTQVGKDATYTEPNGTESLLNDRPSLVLEARILGPTGDPYPVTVIVNHLRSLSGVDDPADGARVRTKRRAQAEFLANYIQSRQVAHPGERIVSVGDYNAFQFSDGYVDSIGTIKGTPTAADFVVLPSPDLVDPDLTNLVELAPASERYSFVFDGNPQLLDHVLATDAMRKRFSRIAFGRSNADFPEAYRSLGDRPERVSDHDAVVAYFAFPAAPMVTLNGDQDLTIEAFTGTYTEQGATAADADGPLPVQITGTVDAAHPGTYTISYTATNTYLTTTVERTVHVVDRVAPSIAGFAITPNRLNVPNHKLADVTALYSITDASGLAACSLGAVSNEPADSGGPGGAKGNDDRSGRGDGHTSVDIFVVDNHHLLLRAERSGTGSGRTYTVTLTCTDPAGNVATAFGVTRVDK